MGIGTAVSWRRGLLRLLGLTAQRRIAESEFRSSLLGAVLRGSGLFLTAQAAILLSSGASISDLLWTTWEPALLLAAAYILNQRQNTVAAAAFLLVGLSHAAAFTHARYGLEHVSGSLLALTIIVCGLLVGVSFIWTWTTVCCLVVLWIAWNQPVWRPEIAAAWCGVYGMTGALIALVASHLERLLAFGRAAEARRNEAIVNERTRFAREVHDTLAQGFTGVIVQLNAAELRLEIDPHGAARHLAKAQELARNSLEEARRSAWALRPNALETSDLLRALTQSAEDLVCGTAVELKVVGEGRPVPLVEDVQFQMLRIGQEAVTNAVRHASATHITITLRYRPEAVELEVQDNGIGITADATTAGLGIQTMRERATEIGGQLILGGSGSRGTTVVAFAPLR